MSEKSAKHQPVRGLAKSVAADIGTRTNATIAGLLALAGVTGIAGGFEEAAPEEVVTAAELAALAVSAAMLLTKDKVFHYRKA